MTRSEQKRQEFLEAYRHYKDQLDIVNVTLNHKEEAYTSTYIHQDIRDLVRSVRELKVFYKGKRLEREMVWAELVL